MVIGATSSLIRSTVALVLRTLRCGWRGHRWRILVADRGRMIRLGHLHTMAGCYALCERCGEIWDDLPDSSERAIARNTLPRARLRP